MISPLPPDEASAGAIASGPVIGQRDFKGRVHRLGAGVRKEHMVQAAWKHARNPGCQFKYLCMAHLESRRIIHFPDLLADGVHDTQISMPGVTTPKPRRTIQNLLTFCVLVKHSFRTDEHTRV